MSDKNKIAINLYTIFLPTLGLIALFLIIFTRGEYFYLETLGIVFGFLALMMFFTQSVIKYFTKVLINYQPLRLSILFGAIGVNTMLLIFVIFTTWIRLDIKTQCQDSTREYGGDCVEALQMLLNDESRGFRARNDAIFALGQLGDARALPTLQSYYTGNISPREPLDEGISQYELKKAVNLTSGGTNILSAFWRHGI